MRKPFRLIEREEVERALALFGAAIGTGRRVASLHTHLSGTEPIGSIYDRGRRMGVRGFRNRAEFDLLIEEGTLDSYIQLNHRIDDAQAGMLGLSEALLASIDHQVAHEGEIASERVFTLSAFLARFNVMKRTGVTRGENGAIETLYDVDLIMEAADLTVRRARRDYPDVKVGLILCFARELPLEVNRIMAEKIVQWRETLPSLVAVDLAGPESSPMMADDKAFREMARLYREAAGDKLKRTLHCGETRHTSVDLFLRTVEAFDPQQVSHPIAAVKGCWDGDKRGLQLLVERGIVVELCYWSNRLTQVIESSAEFGRVLDTLDEWSIPYTFSTDSPVLQGTTLAEELGRLLLDGAITPDQINRGFAVAEKSVLLERLPVA